MRPRVVRSLSTPLCEISSQLNKWINSGEFQYGICRGLATWVAANSTFVLRRFSDEINVYTASASCHSARIGAVVPRVNSAILLFSEPILKIDEVADFLIRERECRSAVKFRAATLFVIRIDAWYLMYPAGLKRVCASKVLL
jgi:hypothetical protein